MNPRPFPVRFRRRLAIAFVLVAGASAGALALGAVVTMERYRTDQFEARADEHVRRDLRLLDAGAPARGVAARLADRQQPGGPGVIVVQPDTVVSSVETLTLADVPARTRTNVQAAPGDVLAGETDLAHGSTLVLGTLDPSTGVELYYFFPRAELLESFDDLRATLLLGWVVVVVVAAVAGTLVARRTLRPVRTAADAARSVAEGLLDTRLPVDARDEFGEWASAFNRMVAALDEKIHALAAAGERERQFTADVAHEVRTPLSSVLAAASHLEERASDLPPDLAEVSHLLVAGARRLDRLTSELLELHRLEGGKDELHLEAVDVGSAVEGAVAANGWRDQVRVDVVDPVVVVTDRHRLDRIVVNLVANALQHGRRGVLVTIGDEARQATVSVSDSGPGISPEDLPRVFDRHFKGSRHRSSTGGSGLGLSIAQESAQRLGGELTATSVLGSGATFVLRLPLELERDEDDGHGEQPGGERRQPGPGHEHAAGEAEGDPAQHRIADRQ